MTSKIKPQDATIVHAVFDEHTIMLEVHNHGLEKYGHPNFSVWSPSIFLASATSLLNSLASAIINDGEVFKAGENCEWGEWGRFTLEEGEDSGDSPVLRIIPVLPECAECGK